MKILHLNTKMNPSSLSVSFLDNKKIRQQFFSNEQLEDFAKENSYLTTEELINACINDQSIIEELIKKFEPNISIDTVKEIVSQNSNGEIDIYDIPLDLQDFLSKIIKDKDSTEEEIISWTRFSKRLQKNIDPYIRYQLFDFLSYLINEGSLAITSEGSFLAYKGLNKEFNSIHSGTAYVDNIKFEGNIPNLPGSVISMPRNEVQADPNSHCSTGLHAGSWKYVKNFGRKYVLVEINPEDVVSIPNDYKSQKLRCCKYRVIKEITEPLNKPIFNINEVQVENIKKEAEVDIKVSYEGTKITDLKDLEVLNVSETKLIDLSKDEIESLDFSNGEKITDLNEKEIEFLSKTDQKLTDLSEDDEVFDNEKNILEKTLEQLNKFVPQSTTDLRLKAEEILDKKITPETISGAQNKMSKAVDLFLSGIEKFLDKNKK